MKFFKDWEYWPGAFFYVPNVPYGFYLAMKARSFTLFSNVNPCIKFSGNGCESKFKTLQLLPENHVPLSIFIQANEDISVVLEQLKAKKMVYPLMIKPDVGCKGLLVRQLKSESELIKFLKNNNFVDLILQEFLDYQNECGIFYHRLPSNQEGEVTSLTLKKFLSVTGDGKSSLGVLVKKHERAKRYLEMIKSNHADKFDSIPEMGEEVALSVIGNHFRGTQFIDGNHLITKELEIALDRFFEQVPDFHYGRLDLKYNSLEGIINQNEFKVIELNGIMADPAHIYDGVSGTYFKALKGIRQHWKIICKIAIQQKKRGHKFCSAWSFLKSIKEFIDHTKKIKNFSK